MTGAISAALVLLVAGTCGAVPAPRRPNLLVVIADDLRADALGAAGNTVIETPALDGLAADGVRFERAFATTPVCAASRASIFGGQWARRHGIEDFTTGFSDAAWAATYPAVLRAAGWRTGFVGKFGVGDVPRADAFDVWHGFAGQGSYYTPERPRHLTVVLGDQALEFLRSQPRGQPFCLTVAFKAPHADDGATREFPPDARDAALYDGVAMPWPTKTEPEFFARLPGAVQSGLGRERWMRRFATPEQLQATVRDYYRLVTGLDREIGRLREGLAVLGLADDTVIVFTADNGMLLGERGLADKWVMYEEALRVPLIVLDPALPARRRGRVVRTMALNVDLAPTLLDRAGVVVPVAMQGTSLRRAVEGPGGGGRRAFLAEHHTAPERIPPSEAVRTRRWKYVRWLDTVPVVEELYDLRRDPEERIDLAGEAAFQERLGKLRRWWKRLSRS
jgi:arylsulfatase A-like enzyme